jgi:D-alanine-D-alanine ligase
MNIGITYDLRAEYLAAGFDEEQTAEFDQLTTIEAIDAALVELGHSTDRIGSARQLVDRLARGDSWDLVFNICEGLHGLGREAQVPAILDVYEMPYTFGDAALLVVCLDKGLTKTVIRAAGVPTPDWLVVKELADLDRFQLAFPVIAKPLAEGTGKGIGATSKVSNLSDLHENCERLITKYEQPVLVEQFLPGREFTVAILGSGRDAESIGVLEIELRKTAEPDVYSFRNKQHCDEFVDYHFPHAEQDAATAEAEQIALAAWRVVGGRDAGRVDLRCDSFGRPQLIEINPLAGIDPTHSDLPMIWSKSGGQYADLIERIVESARTRINCHARRVSLQ